MDESPLRETPAVPAPKTGADLTPASRPGSAPAADGVDGLQVQRARGVGLRGALVWLLTTLVAVPATVSQVRDRSYPPQGSVPPHDIDEDQAEFLYKQQREDSGHTDDKVKQLLTLSSALTTAIVAFTRDVQPRWLVAIVMGLLIACVFLCLSVLSVRTSNMPTLEDANREDLEKQWAKDLLSSCFANRGRHAFRVDRYRAAGRYFTLALLLTPFIVLFSVSKPDPTDKVAQAVERVERAISAQAARLEAAVREAAPAPSTQQQAGSSDGGAPPPGAAAGPVPGPPQGAGAAPPGPGAGALGAPPSPGAAGTLNPLR